MYVYDSLLYVFLNRDNQQMLCNVKHCTFYFTYVLSICIEFICQKVWQLNMTRLELSITMQFQLSHTLLIKASVASLPSPWCVSSWSSCSIINFADEPRVEEHRGRSLFEDDE